MSNTFNLGNGNWATKKEAVLAYNSENSNFKPLPFTFDRGSIATVVNSDGLIETVGVDEPRIDFLNNSKGHLLLEPQRTNSLLQSNQFDTTWTTTNATVTSGQTGVGGSTDAWLLNSSAGYLRQTVSLSGASTMSVYAKKGTAQGIRIRIDASVDANCYIDLSDGSEFFPNTGTNLDVTNVGNNWYRISLSIDSTIGNVRFYALDNTGSNTSGTIYIQYAQLEAGSYATSYIPTQGSAVTRSAESCNGAGNSNVFNDSEGVLYVEMAKSDVTAIEGGVRISRDTSNEIRLNFAPENRLNVFVNVGGSNQVYMDNASYNLADYHKIAIKYKLNDYAVYVDGTEIHTDTSATVPTGLDEFYFKQFYGNVKEIKVYNTALTDAELIALTT